jgi:predicted RNA-binding protein with PIN domain
MRYLIDGHNLIPKIRTLSLKDLDDEEKLISLLNRFATKARAQVEVYFDQAPIDSARNVKIGAVRVHFIRAGSSADAALIERMRAKGMPTAGITVVSSDHAIQNEARRMKFTILRSEAFAALIDRKLTSSGGIQTKETTLSKDEIEEWMKVFNKQN